MDGPSGPTPPLPPPPPPPPHIRGQGSRTGSTSPWGSTRRRGRPVPGGGSETPARRTGASAVCLHARNREPGVPWSGLVLGPDLKTLWLEVV